MCNLYTLKAERWEIDAYFQANNAWRDQVHDTPANFAAEVYPGYPGLVFAEQATRSMNWGFPLAMKSKKTGLPLKPKPVNNARTDKLHTPFWKPSFERRRCLIPLTAFGEAEGEPGRMTRTWLSIPGQPIFAAAGIWRWSEEWGEVYSMVMTDPCDASADVHDRMPVIIAPADQPAWLGGSSDEAGALCVPWAGEIAIDRTDQPWAATRTR